VDIRYLEYLLNDVIRCRLHFGLLQRGSYGLHMSFISHQLELIILDENIQSECYS